MKSLSTRRTAMTSLTVGAAGIAAGSLMPARSALAALSSGAGVVAGGSLEGPDGPVQFSAFGSRLKFDDGSENVIQAAFSWYDPTGYEGEPLTLSFVAVGDYGPGDVDDSRMISGTVAVNGDGEHPFALWLVETGEIGTSADTVRLVVGSSVADLIGTPESAATEHAFDYEVEGDLTTGDVQLISFG